MSYQYEVKQTPAVDGSKVLPFDKLNAEIFYPTRRENTETTEIVKLMASEVAETILNELHDPRKATSNYLTSVEGKFSWGQTTDKEHHAFLGKMATNDPAESPFASLTHQLQSFGHFLGFMLQQLAMLALTQISLVTLKIVPMMVHIINFLMRCDSRCCNLL